MPTRGPLLRTVQRPVKGTRGFRLGLPVGTQSVNVSTLVLRRPVPILDRHDLGLFLWVPADTLNVREVVADGVLIGIIAAHSPSPSNATRPTSYVFRSVDGSVVLNDWRLEDLRAQIDRAYPEGAELPTRKD